MVWDWPAVAADPQPVEQVEHVPPEEAFAILGMPVAGPDGKTIGRLVDVLVDASGTPQAGVIDVGGFMGVGTRTIAVHWSTLHFAPASPGHPITLDLTLDQIKAAPEYRYPNKPAPVVLPAIARGGSDSGKTGGGATGGGATGNAKTSSGTTGGEPANRTMPPRPQ
ncbi:MAG TPA: PRC-barrel domain-containing protein [Acetobacteraceae bacterium]|nr:PRC-barrel domain-containing protein [Acetobacteraceae bacterium]